MNWTVIIETIVMTAAFMAMVLLPLVKNPVWWIHDYPKDIQEEYFKTHERVPSDFFLPGTEHMDKAYHQKRYHFVHSLWGMLIGLIPCLAGAGQYAWLF